ncbi:glycosyltransferase family 2 protein [Rhodoplanes sp. Z2-YC6860]|uniref:glycosyltransferase family 2 protein n=1 Tax=Rhodoplanes sp. Z2-YC6860 TaxID=674703 RepID=UPI00078D4320|nr:glycosyltransferase family 2 protein [Rhodoplanes sp. Z2-YC6860]AMN38984.1 glycosyltransferase [Rhodoplanes sp. Z2-YC6860]
MTIHLYTRCWNDAHMLPFFFKNYDPWVDRYFVYDDGSEDNSLALLRAHPRTEVRSQPPYSDPASRIASQLDLQNEIWKEARGKADWVIVVDLDEHLYHPRIIPYLRKCKANSVTVISALGFQMISNSFPNDDGVSLFDFCSTGMPDRTCTKLSIFDPNEIDRTNFEIGLHHAAFEGRVLAPDSDELFLLHFHFLDVSRVVARHKLYLTRQRPKDLENQWGVQYTWSEEKLRDQWARLERGSTDIKREPWEHKRHPGRDKWCDIPRTRLLGPVGRSLRSLGFGTDRL